MPSQLQISLGQYSDRGRKETNQDFHGAYIPTEPQLSVKGIAIAVADGISTSSVSRVASEAAVKAFLDDYYCTSQAWSVKKSAHRVLAAINSWLYSQTHQSQYRYDKDRGYVCTFSGIIIKSRTLHVFHVGDTRVYRVQGDTLEQLTNDHRLRLSEQENYLSRALGMHPQMEIDYRSFAIETGDTFVLATDGVYQFVSGQFISQAAVTHSQDLDQAAKLIVHEAHRQGSDDNITIQIVRIDSVAFQDAQELHQQLTELPFPPDLEPRTLFEGYRIVRELHASSRSHVYLAVDQQTGASVVIKTPSIDLRQDPAYLERFLMEDWIAQRINSAYVLKPFEQARKRNFLYTAMEYVEGQSLTQWMIDHPKPELEAVRNIAEQIARGLLAFHRADMLHQDLRPENVLIDPSGTVKIIDFGSTRVAGIAEIDGPLERQSLLGTAQYTAPEYFLGEAGTTRSDIFSLGVIVYQMLCGGLPYGTEVAKARTKSAQRALSYRSVLDENREIPAWIDTVLKKATHPEPLKRYEELSEFVYDLRHPSAAFLSKAHVPLIERNPVAFWRTVSLLLAVIVMVLLLKR